MMLLTNMPERVIVSVRTSWKAPSELPCPHIPHLFDAEAGPLTQRP